jgi:group I intron endonuclease
MIGIYKIISPTGRVYIGQSIDLEARQKIYARRGCKNQVRLYASLVKYGFSKHIFEVVEECKVEELNVRERHWQDIYDVLSENGLNCKLQSTQETKAVHSQNTVDKIRAAKKVLYSTSKGAEVKSQIAETLRAYNMTEEGKISRSKSAASRDEAIRIKNTDFTVKVANTDYNQIAEKNKKTINQYGKDEKCIREWSSGREASESLGIDRGNISACCKGKLKTAGGFIWKYSENN